jgi:hypothetical protein
MSITRFEVKDPNGRLVAVHVREDGPQGKRMWWERPDGTPSLGGTPASALPLYGSERLRDSPGEPVVVVEGEKAAKVLLNVGILAVGTVTGAHGAPGDEALRPLVERRVILWPDSDEPGRQHMTRIGARLRALGCKYLCVVDWPDAPPGGDAADFVDLHGEGLALDELLAAARPFEEVAPAPDGPQLLTAGEILAAADDPEPEWLVEGLLPQGGLAVLAGRPKTGKSVLARALAVAVAQGRDFLERPARKGAVLLLSLEDRKRDVSAHLRRLGLRPEDPLLVATAADGVAQVEKWVATHRPILVMVDTVSRLVRLRDIAAYSEVVAGLDRLLRLARNSGVHILLLHHAPKGSDTRDAVDAPLGSIAISGTADVLLHLKRAQDGTRTLASVQRTGEDLQESVLILGPDGWPALAGTQREHQARQVAEQIAAYLGKHGESTRQEILESVPGDNTAKVAALALLEADGRVTKSGAGRRGDPYRYALADSVLPSGIYPADGKTETQNRHEARFYQGEIPSAGNGHSGREAAFPADGILTPREPQPLPLARAGGAPSEAPRGRSPWPTR